MMHAFHTSDPELLKVHNSPVNLLHFYFAKAKWERPEAALEAPRSGLSNPTLERAPDAFDSPNTSVRPLPRPTAGSLPLSTTKLTAAILHDHDRAGDRSPQNLANCFSCGQSMIYRGSQGDDSGRFCSTRCREWHDAGNPPWDSHYAGKSNPLWYGLLMGPHGFFIDCASCGKRFDSKGPRCCSIECERRYRERKDNAAIMAEVGMEAAAKRRCEACGGPIPNWRNGRRVSKATRFCSPACQKRQSARNSNLGVQT
jgi:hypothetical protein